jgi:spore photoproduct lyase
MFNRVFAERDILGSDTYKNITSRLSNNVEVVDDIMDIWGRVKKPYLQKRDSLNLFIGKKRGQLVKETPPAYGLTGGKHYYFIHAYNCIFECQYCYLQGYFNSPDIVLFVNHDEICSEITRLAHENSHQTNWFHAGEYSDSLALSGLTNEWPIYWKAFKGLKNAKLELRTKSSNIRSIENLEPLSNIILSFSLSSERASREVDLKTPPLDARLKAIQKLVVKGFRIGIHLDPMIYHPNYEEQYQNLVEKLSAVLPCEQCEYISIGVVRFTKDVFRKFSDHYPRSEILAGEFTTTDSGLVRYHKPIRMQMMNKVKTMLENVGYDNAKIYLCMESSCDN